MIHVYGDVEGEDERHELLGAFYDSIPGRAAANALVAEDPDHRFAMVMVSQAL